MQNNIRAAIIGYGIVGARRGVYIKKSKFLDLVAISDIKFKKKISYSQNITHYKYYKDLLQKEKLDAIFITLPNYLAAELTSLCLKRDIHVFCEKPPARNLKELLKVKRIKDKKKNLVLMYGFNHRYHSSIKIAKKFIEKKKLGNIINFRCVYGKSKIKTFEIRDWRSQRRFSGGGILLDQGIHMLDLIRYFYGDFNQYYSCISNNYWNYDVEDNAFILLRDTKRNVIASLHSTATEWEHKFSMEITLQKGIIELKGILSGTKSYGKETIRILSKKQILNNQKGIFKNFKVDNSWEEEINEFTNLIIKKNSKYSNNITEAVSVMKMVDKIYRSDKKWYNYTKKNEHIF